MTKQVAAHLGFPDLRIIAIGHPLGASDEATVRGFADAVVEQALELLTGDSAATVPVAESAPGPPAGDHPGVAEIRDLLQADGGNVTVTSIADGVVEMRLELRDASCADCVLPRPTLEAMSRNILQRHDPTVTAVRIDDPREHPDWKDADGDHD